MGDTLPGRLCPPRLDRLGEGAAARETLRAYFEDSWQLTEWLFEGLEPAHLAQQPDPRRQPLVFYLGHAAVFYVNKLRRAGLVEDPIDAELEDVFAKGVDPKDAADLGARAWPDAARVRAYRTRVHDFVHAQIDRAELPETIGPDDPWWSLLMGFEHDRIHFETSSVLMRQSAEPLPAPRGWTIDAATNEAPTLRWLRMPPRPVRLGRTRLETFAWDNELGREEHEVPPFDVGTTLVSNAHFQAFVDDGGYADQRLWTTEGWAWRSAHEVTRPPFWDDAGQVRHVFGWAPRDPAAPVEVTAHEARAYATWAGARLPTEAEWAAYSLGAPRRDDDFVGVEGLHLALRVHSPQPVDSSDTTPLGIHDAAGNVWQWLSDDFRPLEGFRNHPLYPDFSRPYFDDQHAALRGGSWASSGTSASRHYRLWFRRDFLQHAGFRLARDAA